MEKPLPDNSRRQFLGSLGAAFAALSLPAALSAADAAKAEAKALPRTVARRTLDSPWGGIGTALSAFSPDECRNDITNCGFSHQ
jgi:hypothetical protein